MNWNLFRRDQVDLKTGTQPGGKIVGQVAGEQVVQHADGAQLLGGDLPRRGEVVRHHARPHLGRGSLRRRAARGLEKCIDLVLLERLFHQRSSPRYAGLRKAVCSCLPVLVNPFRPV